MQLGNFDGIFDSLVTKSNRMDSLSMSPSLIWSQAELSILTVLLYLLIHGILMLAKGAELLRDNFPPLQVLWQPTEKAKSFCSIFYLPPHTLKSSEWDRQGPGITRTVPANSQPGRFLPLVRRRVQGRGLDQCMITDGSTLIMILLSSDSRFLVLAIRNPSPPISFWVGWLVFEKLSLNNLFIHPSVGRESYCQEAKNSELEPLPSQLCIDSCRRYAEFDFYRLQRYLDYWERFKAWKTQMRAYADNSTHQIKPDDRWTVERNNFAKENLLICSSIPFPTIPAETIRRVLQRRGPRDYIADTATGIANSQTFTFQIKAAIRAKPDTFSQVFSGHIVGPHGRVSSLLCIKLFDERFFRAPGFHRH
ncbi:hypothetical protein M422DRAFT_51216 [Sphaerobolus stellatus SS14]|uniref:Uncharacterized protein n=1 Tax=Sphaerobolus stellatus (strain SS14) TaxID=990650 RepID=A0A0C9VFM2_SPHS4|nr:hypothetical protein M422DRAFT_51216 [Sphaerobolus stellatus SS14]